MHMRMPKRMLKAVPMLMRTGPFARQRARQGPCVQAHVQARPHTRERNHTVHSPTRASREQS